MQGPLSAGAAAAFLPDELTSFGEVPLEKGVSSLQQTLPGRGAITVSKHLK